MTHSTFWAYERAMNWLDEADKGWAKQLDGAFGSWVAVMTAQLFDVPDERHAFDRPRQALAKNWGASRADCATSVRLRARTPGWTRLGCYAP